MPQTLLIRRAQTRELARPVLVPDLVPAPEPLRLAALAELSCLLDLPIVNVRHQPATLVHSARTPATVRARLLGEDGEELRLAWFIAVAGTGVVVLRDSGAIVDMTRLDAWRAAVTGRPAETLPLLRAVDRQRALQLLHQLHGLTELERVQP